MDINLIKGGLCKQVWLVLSVLSCHMYYKLIKKISSRLYCYWQTLHNNLELYFPQVNFLITKRYIYVVCFNKSEIGLSIFSLSLCFRWFAHDSVIHVHVLYTLMPKEIVVIMTVTLKLISPYELICGDICFPNTVIEI